LLITRSIVSLLLEKKAISSLEPVPEEETVEAEVISEVVDVPTTNEIIDANQITIRSEDFWNNGDTSIQTITQKQEVTEVVCTTQDTNSEIKKVEYEQPSMLRQLSRTSSLVAPKPWEKKLKTSS